MAKVMDVDGSRGLSFEGNNVLCPNSVFITGRGFCMEFDKNILVDALKREFRLADSMDRALERMFAIAA